MTTEEKEVTDIEDICEFAQSGSICAEVFNCCDCGGNDCGCGYCWSCNACEICKNKH